MHFVGVVILGLILGLHPKDVSYRRLFETFVLILSIIPVMIISGMVMGHGFYSIISLDAATVIVAGLTVLYGIALGVIVKAIKKLKD